MTLPVQVFAVRTAEGEIQYLAACAEADSAFTDGLPSEAVLGAMPDDWTAGDALTATGFRQNPVFVTLLHQTIARYAPELPGFGEAAREQGEGSLAIIDQRTPDPGGAVPPVDVLGAFEVVGGALAAYHANPNYRLLTERGFTKLDETLEARLMEKVCSHL